MREFQGRWWGEPEKCRGGADKGKSGTMSLRRKLQARKSDAVLRSSQSSPRYYYLLIEMFLIVFVVVWLCHSACGILAPQGSNQGSNSHPLPWKLKSPNH